MPLHLPESVIAAEIDRAIEQQVASEVAEAKHWNRELQRIDPNLDLVHSSEKADEFGLEPACWHIRRRNPGTVDSYMPLMDDAGNRREPGSWMLDNLEANDLWNPQVHRDIKETRRRLREAKHRAKKREKEQRMDEMALAARAARRLRGESQFTQTMVYKRAGKGINKAG